MEDLKMLRYWREEKGDINALEDYFPELLNSDPALRALVAQVRMLQSSISAHLDKIVQLNPSKE